MAGHHWRRGLFGAGILVALALLVGGVVLGYRGFQQTAGPGGAVRGYFAALSRSDAPRALSFGTVPAGPHPLLTSAVLREQQRIAPMRDVSITSIRQDGTSAHVSVHYVLAYPGAAQQRAGVVTLQARSGDWRLTTAAIATELSMPQARQRATILGANVPPGTSLLFPGAPPIRFDSPFLQLDPHRDSIDFGADPSTEVVVDVSGAGRDMARTAVGAAIRACLAGRGGRTCPQPSERYIPGSVRGSIDQHQSPLSVDLDDSPAGVLTVSGKVECTGTSRRLNFENRVVSVKGRFELPVHADAYAVAPLRFSWSRA